MPPAGYVPPADYQIKPADQEEEVDEDEEEDAGVGPLPASSQTAQRRAAVGSY